MWQRPEVQRHAEKISNPENDNSTSEKQVLEALRNGVQLNSLVHFLNVDDVVVLRPRFSGSTADRDRQQAISLAFRQLGKAYDFNFDVNTTDKIVCSELAYVSYPTLPWPTERTLGRHSISPDNVAQLAAPNGPLELVVFYHDGQLLEGEEARNTFDALLAQ